MTRRWPELHNAQTRKRAWNEHVRAPDLVMNRINDQATMVKKRLKNLVNVALLSSGGGGMFVRVALVCVWGLGAGILGAGWAAAEDLAPDQASAFVVGKLFSGKDTDSDAPAVDATVVSRVICACDHNRNYQSDARRLHTGDACTGESSRLVPARQAIDVQSALRPGDNSGGVQAPYRSVHAP